MVDGVRHAQLPAASARATRTAACVSDCLGGEKTMPCTSIQDCPQAAEPCARRLRRSVPFVPLAAAALLAVAVPAVAAPLGAAVHGKRATAESSRAMLVPDRRTAHEASVP